MYVNAKTVVIGNGTGSVSQTSMTGLTPGDVLAIRPGSYTGGNFSNLSGITIINNGGLVTFTGFVTLANNVDVTISGTGLSSLQYGFAFSGGGFNITSRCQGLRLYNFYANKTGRFIDVSENQTTTTYNGTANSIRLQNATLANLRLINCGNMICGSFGHAYNLANFVDSIAAYNIIYDSVPDIGQVVSAANIYRFDFHDMTIHLPSTVHSGKDIGVFSINGGTGQLHNIYRSGGWGWLIRIFGAAIGNVPGDVWVYDNIDLNGTCYGTAEVRSDSIEWSNTNNLLTGINIHIINNTGGNKIDNFGTYTTAVALIPNLVPGYTAEVRNNLAFNNQNPGRAGGGVEFWQPANPPVMSNNFYYNDYNAAGLVDAVNCFLKSTSPVVDAGTTVSRTNKDFAGVSRPQGKAYDAGAREFNQNTPPPTNQAPVAKAGNNQTITLPTNSASLDGSASSDPDGTIASYTWAQISGPSTATITNGTTAKPTVGTLQAGTYVFELTVKDNAGATAKAQVTITVNSPANQAPVAKAGANQTITLPTNSATLDGSGSADPDGTIASYSWAQISGPSAAVITNGTTSKPTVGSLQAGAYIFELTVVDNSGATAKSQTTITVNSPTNQTPIANAGGNQTITLPTNSATLNGSASSDPDGTIASYAWAQISGPTTSTVTNADSSKATVSNLQAGTYTYELTVTDNIGAIAKAQVKVIVNPVAKTNQLPVANAGTDKTITLPTNSTSLDGSASSDPDGTIAGYSWAQISGPSTSTIANGTTAKPTVSALQAGTYTYELTVTDDSGATAKAQVKVIVNNAAANQSPVANAGANQTLTLPTNSTSLNGSASSDPDGTIASYSWSQVSGPGGTITNATGASTTVIGLTAGTYVFKLVVTDNSGATATANVTVVVNPAVNLPPTANAGADQTITLPTNSVNVDGSASGDADGTIASYSWSQNAGPSSATIANGAGASTAITGLVAGTYVFKLVVTDNNGASATDSVIIKVNAAPNQAPIANAGTSKSITLPTNSVGLNGSASSDPDGTIASYSWAQITGPGASTITGGNTATPTASNLVAGTYTFELTVTDNSGANAKAQVKITVAPAAAPNTPPLANAGGDMTITLPTNSVNLDASASQGSSGTITNYTWTQSSGPSTATIATPNGVTTAASGLVQGVYVFKLVVTDNNGLTDTDSVAVRVNKASNKGPAANAGQSKTVTLPKKSVALSGSGSDPDGTITSYSWTQVGGPSAATITAATTTTPTVDNLQAGQYTFQLTVTDNDGASASAQVKVIVLAAPNQAPVANAGIDKAITLPANSIALDGSASSDPDGTIASYSWVKVSGPGTPNISNANTATPSVTGMQAGAYIFELTVTDNSGATATDQVTISVNAAVTPPATNQPPIANAGSDATIQAPTNAVNLNGTNSYDPDGSITSYNWAQVSGPSASVLQNPTTGTPSAHNLVAGTYVYELTVTDNDGATEKDRVTITVKAATQTQPPVTNNTPPVANAGQDQTITLPTSTTMLDGSASTDQNGTITSYQWTQMNGPNTATISSFSGATSEVSDLVAGEYTFQLTVTDNNGSNSTATVKVRVVDNLRSTESMLVYPNPAHDVVNVRLISDSLGTVKVNIYDMNGKLVHASQMDKPTNVVEKTISVDRLASGMYTLQAVIGSNKILISKLIKQ